MFIEYVGDASSLYAQLMVIAVIIVIFFFFFFDIMQIIVSKWCCITLSFFVIVGSDYGLGLDYCDQCAHIHTTWCKMWCDNYIGAGFRVFNVKNEWLKETMKVYFRTIG